MRYNLRSRSESGGRFLPTQKRFAESAAYSTHGMPAHAPEIFLNSVVRPSFDLPLVIILAVCICLVMVLMKSAKRHFMRADKTPPLNQYFLFYLAAWATGPCVLVYFFYFVGGWERYVSRYLWICIPPFTILLVLALEQIVDVLDAAGRKLNASARRYYLRNPMLYALLACAIFALPGAYEAAEGSEGTGWPRLARSIVTLVEQDPHSSFAIFDAARRDQSLLEYYLERFSKAKQLRVDGTFRLSEEQPGQDPLKRIEAKVAGRDYLIVAFPFDGVNNFPVLMASLQNKYHLGFSQLGPKGRGYLSSTVTLTTAWNPASVPLPAWNAQVPSGGLAVS